MTDAGFELVLHDPQQAGVFFVGEGDIATLETGARDAGLLVRRIDLHGCTGKDALLQRIADALSTPEGQGRNWDALSDQLRDLSWLPARGYALLLPHAAGLRDAEEACFDTLLDILDDATIDWQERDVPFWAFLALPDDEFPDATAGDEGLPSTR